MYIPYNKNLKENATNLRNDMTPQEKHLWYDFLSKYPVKVNRQKMLDNYIADFYCHKAKLVIELDGSQHFEKNHVLYDKTRTQALNTYDIKVLRFNNLAVDKNFKVVCLMIHNEIQNRIKDFKEDAPCTTPKPTTKTQ